MMLGKCGPNASPFIEAHFHDCVETTRDYVGFGLGMAAIVLWVFAQLPQFVTNIKNQSAEALSAWFLASWLMGDTTNLLGCLLQGDQLPTTTYTAMYFVAADVVMMLQYIYYIALAKRRQALLRRAKSRRTRSKQHSVRTGSGVTSNSPSRSYSYAHVHSAGGVQYADALAEEQQQQQRHEVMEAGREAAQHGDAEPRGPAGVPDAATAVLQQQRRQQFITSLEAPGLPVGTKPMLLLTGLLVSALVWQTASSFSATRTAPGNTLAAAHFGSSIGGGSLDGTSFDLDSSFGSSSGSSPAAATIGYATQQLLLQQHPHGTKHRGVDYTWWAGTLMGYTSTCLYLMSRVSQIWRNYSRRSADGLSLAMFMCAVTANVCTGTGILLRTYSAAALLRQLPWVIGSLGTIWLDCIICYQATHYSGPAPLLRLSESQRHSLPDVEQPLLGGASSTNHAPPLISSGHDDQTE